jgi:hypothetical protein
MIPDDDDDLDLVEAEVHQELAAVVQLIAEFTLTAEERECVEGRVALLHQMRGTIAFHRGMREILRLEAKR